MTPYLKKCAVLHESTYEKILNLLRTTDRSLYEDFLNGTVDVKLIAQEQNGHYNLGYERGHQEGTFECDNEAYQRGYDEGYDAGFEAGRIKSHIQDMYNP